MIPIPNVDPHSLQIKQYLDGEYGPAIFQTYRDGIYTIAFNNRKELVYRP